MLLACDLRDRKAKAAFGLPEKFQKMEMTKESYRMSKEAKSNIDRTLDALADIYERPNTDADSKIKAIRLTLDCLGLSSKKKLDRRLSRIHLSAE